MMATTMLGRYIKAREIKLSEQAHGKIGTSIRNGDWYEADMLLHIRSLNIEGFYLDVGANIGNHSMHFALNTLAARVYSVEADAEARSIFYENISLNTLGEKIVVLPFAATERREMVDFYTVGGRSSKRRQAAGVRLDDVVPSGVGLVKMDIEGAEAIALRGMTRILTEDRPRLFIEANDDAMLQAIDAIIAPLGYSQTGKVFNPSPTYEFLC